MTSPLIDENALLRRIEAIERWQREFGPSIAQSFGTTVSALTATVAALEDAVEDIATLTADQVATGFGEDTQTGFSISTSVVTKATATITRPTGYTQAIITAFCYGIVGNNGGGIAQPSVYIYADGTLVSSGPAGGIGYLPVSDYAAYDLGGVIKLTGLAGASIDVDVRLDASASMGTAPGNAAHIQAVAIFTK